MCRWTVLLQWKLQSETNPTNAWKRLFCGCNGKTSTIGHQQTRWSSPSKQSSYSATVSTIWDEQACTHDTFWRQNCITTSKESSINGHILLKYFELVFLQLQLVKFRVNVSSFDWIINERKRGPFYETPYLNYVKQAVPFIERRSIKCDINHQQKTAETNNSEEKHHVPLWRHLS